MNEENFDYYEEVLQSINNYNEDELNEAILCIEEIKNMYRCKNKNNFELFDELQEKCYQQLETKFNVSHNKSEDLWNKKIEDD